MFRCFSLNIFRVTLAIPQKARIYHGKTVVVDAEKQGLDKEILKNDEIVKSTQANIGDAFSRIAYIDIKSNIQNTRRYWF